MERYLLAFPSEIFRKKTDVFKPDFRETTDVFKPDFRETTDVFKPEF